MAWTCSTEIVYRDFTHLGLTYGFFKRKLAATEPRHYLITQLLFYESQFMTDNPKHPDNDVHKGAVEDDSPHQEHNTSMRGQLGHRNQDEMLKDNDSDYPEPGSNPEHSGESEESQDSASQKKTSRGGNKNNPAVA